VIIPSGSSSWSTTQLNYTVPAAVTNLTIQGKTVVNCTGTAGTSSYACVATDTTVLTDSYDAGQTFWQINTGSASTILRITGITFQGGTISVNTNKSDGFIKFTGSSQNLRVDHCHFNTQTYSFSPRGAGISMYGVIYGVADHNLLDVYGPTNGFRSYFEAFGDTAFSQPSQLGSANFFFVENNQTNGGFLNDCNQGGRQVVRYNSVFASPYDTASDSGAIQTHQIGQGVSRVIGCRALERYHNYLSNPTPTYPIYTAGDNTSGSGVTWGETLGSGYNFYLGYQVIARVLSGNNCGSQGCPALPNGFGYCGSGSTGVLSAWDGNTDSTGYPCLNQVGRGQMLSPMNGLSFPSAGIPGCTPTSPSSSCSAWPSQLLEPEYQWMSTIGGTPLYTTQTHNGVVPVINRDFYMQVSPSANSSPTSPFNGTTGTGFGTLANRPTTCTAGAGGTYGRSPTGSYGVAYWATDQNGGNGELYVCTATNTWTATYTPYTYPHPLIAGGALAVGVGGAPNPPSGLVATVQ
jgi:hypothetical protein